MTEYNTRLFRVTNANGIGCWIVAPNEISVLEVALKTKHIKKPISKKIVVKDVTNFYADNTNACGLPEILNGEI